jgi:LEA14-like dessication related protein
MTIRNWEFLNHTYNFNESAPFSVRRGVGGEAENTHLKNLYSKWRTVKKIFISFFILSGIIFSCKKPQSFDYRGMKNFKIENWGFDYSTVSMDLVYFNPNNFGVELKHVDCDIYLNNNYAGKYFLDTLMHIDRKVEFSFPSRINVDMKGLFKNGLNVLMNKEVLVTLKGNTKVGKAGVFINFPFNYEGRFKVDLF